MTSGMTHPRWVLLRVVAGGLLVLGVLAGGLVFALRPAHASGTPKNPDLVADPPDNIYLEEVSEEGAPHLLMRFNGYVHNAGPGALEIRSHRAFPSAYFAHKGELETYTKVMEERDSLTPEQRKKREEHGEPTEPETVDEYFHGALHETELVAPSMEVIQNRFMGVPKKPGEGEHVAENISAKGAEMVYVNADGHHHWHLNHVASYSLYNLEKTAIVAPAMKVGFCMEDSQPMNGQRLEEAVYSEGAGRHFCQFYHPWTNEVWEGISPGWRDIYSSTLSLQWVDATAVIPGEYWLREDINPLGFLTEEANPPAQYKKYEYAKSSAIVPGYDALGESLSTAYETPLPVTLKARKFENRGGEYKNKKLPLGPPQYEMVAVAQPAHGRLSGGGEHWTYTPEPGFSGTDSFQYTAQDPNSAFPAAPFRYKATVAIQVGTNSGAHVSITGAPSTLVAGTSGPLEASVEGSTNAIEWSASGGASVQGEGPGSRRATVTAPAAPGTVTVTAHIAGYPSNASTTATATISVVAAPAQNPAPSLPQNSGQQPGGGGVAGTSTKSLPLLPRPRAMLVGKLLVMTVEPGHAGRVRLTAYLGRQILGRCSSRTPGARAFTCHVHLKLSKPRSARIKVVAELHYEHTTKIASRGPEHIPSMLMAPMGVVNRKLAHTAAYGNLQYWCSPSTLTETLTGGEE